MPISKWDASNSRAIGLIPLVAAWFCATAGSAVAEPVRLSPPDAHSSHINPLLTSHDSQWVVFTAGLPEQLYRMPIGGGPFELLNAPLPQDHYVWRAELFADDSRVVYMTRERDGTLDVDSELHSVPLQGGASDMLSLPSERIYSFELSPTGEHVLYQTDQVTNLLKDTFVVSATGDERLTVPGRPLGFTPDGKHVLYTDTFAENANLYRQSLDDGSSLRLSLDLATGEGVYPYTVQASSDSQRVIYQVSKGVGVSELYSVSLNGGASTRLSDPGGQVVTSQITPDGASVVYHAAPAGAAELDFHWYSVRVAGGTSTRLSPTLPENHIVLPQAVVSPTSTHLAFTVSTPVVPSPFGSIDASELYSVSLEGGTPALLSAPIDINDPKTVGDVRFSPDGSRVVYLHGFRGSDGGNRGFDLFSVPVEGGDPTLLSFAQEENYRGAEGYAISPNGDWVAFVQQLSPGDPSEALFVVPIAGGTPLQLSTPQPIVSDLAQSDIYEHALQFSPDGRYIIYRQNDVVDVTGASAISQTAVYAVALPVTVPEPSGGLLLVAGAVLIGLCRWRRVA